MDAFNKFNNFVQNVANGQINLGSDPLKFMLTNTAPSATNNVYSDISEIAAGNGYTTGGLSIATTSSSQTGGLYALLLAASSSVLNATGPIPPFRYVVLYDTVGSKCLIGWFDYGSVINLTTGDPFNVAPNQSPGILTLQ